MKNYIFLILLLLVAGCSTTDVVEKQTWKSTSIQPKPMDGKENANGAFIRSN